MLTRERLDEVLDDHDGVRLYCCDVLKGLDHLPKKSVRCVVTSPPYWGLRDYGTAKWEGGNEDCSHTYFRGGHGNKSSKQLTSSGTQQYQYRDRCRECGARRIDNQIGLESTPEEYVSRLVSVFREVRRVLTDDGSLWLNLGDSYAGSMKGLGANGKHYGGAKQQTNAGSVLGALSPSKSYEIGLKPKDLVGIPWMVAFALRNDGWYLRQDIIWAKPNPMPESVRDRCTKAHEYLFLLTKSPRYFFDIDAIKEQAIGKPHSPGNKALAGGKTDKGHLEERVWASDGLRQKRSVWWLTTKPYRGAHFATFPEDLVEPCLLAGSTKNDVVMDIFSGSGTVGVVAKRLGRRYVGLELNKEYVKMAKERIFQ